MGAFAREQAELAATGVPGRMADVHGAPTTLYAAAGSSTSLLALYRGAEFRYKTVTLTARSPPES